MAASSKRLTWNIDGGEDETKEEEMQKKKRRRLRSPSSSSSSTSDEDMQPTYFEFFVQKLEKQIPDFWLLWSKGWTSLLKDSSPSFDSALQSELVSLSHWFLSVSTQVPEQFKDAKQALELISSETSMMSIDHQASNYSLETLLESENKFLIQQACSAIAFLCWWCYKRDVDHPFGDGVVEKLFNLVKQSDKYSPHLIHARLAICSIACVDDLVKGRVEKIIIESRPDTTRKWPFLFGDTDAEHACMFAACILGVKEDDDTWNTKVEALIPPIVDVMGKAREADDIPLMVAAAYAISSATSAATPVQMDKLFDLGCLRALTRNLDVPSPHLVINLLDGIENILYAGHLRENKKYVDWIEYDYESPCVAAYKKHRYESRGIDESDECPGMKFPGWVAFKNVGDGFQAFPHDDMLIILQYKAFCLADSYGDYAWADLLLFEYEWLNWYPDFYE